VSKEHLLRFGFGSLKFSTKTHHNHAENSSRKWRVCQWCGSGWSAKLPQMYTSSIAIYRRFSCWLWWSDKIGLYQY